MICALILASGPLLHGANLRVQEGRPIVDGVFVNGHGPYRFLVDTGTNVNLIETNLARSIGLKATSQVDLASVGVKTSVLQSDDNQVVLDTARAEGQRFLFSPLEAVRNFSPDIRGVLGQWFLSQFDYTLDLRGKRLEFLKQDLGGTHVPVRMVNGRLALSTNLGEMILDSGAAWSVLFGVQPDKGLGVAREFQTITGSLQIGVVSVKALVIEGRTVWRGDALAIPNRPEPGVDGLMPISLFKTVYVCNSEGYVVFK